MDFSFLVNWVKGKTHYIVDALNDSLLLHPVRKTSRRWYCSLLCWQQNQGARRHREQHFTRIWWNFYNLSSSQGFRETHFPNLEVCDRPSRLSVRTVNNQGIVVLDGTRIVVPHAARKDIVRSLHAAHSGMTKTLKTASQLYYWPAMKSDIQSSLMCATLVKKDVHLSRILNFCFNHCLLKFVSQAMQTWEHHG